MEWAAKHPDKPWKDMVKLKRYRYHTLFLKINENGTSYCESFLNVDVDEKRTGEYKKGEK